MTRSAVSLAILVVLALGAKSFLAEGATPTGSGAALAFGFLLLAASQVGRIFHTLHLPHLTGYLLCGAIFGPQVLGIVTREMVSDLLLVKGVAVGLIAVLAGCELNLRELRPRLRAIGALAGGGMLIALLLLFTTFFSATFLLPATSDLTTGERLTVALLCANALIAFSPPVVIGIISETRAAGLLSSLSVSIVVLADLAIVVSFSLTSSLARAVFPGQGGAGGIDVVILHIFGSLGVGLAVGLALALYVARARRRTGLFLFGILFVVAEAGGVLHIDPLLAGLAAGLFVENISPVSGHEVERETRPLAMPTFTVFFAVMGAEAHLDILVDVAPYAVGAALVRAAGLVAGTRLFARTSGVEPRLARLVPFGMFPQAGIALALASAVRASYHGWGDQIGTILLGTVVVNELAGPILLRAALGWAGEAGKKDAPTPAAPSRAAPAASAPDTP